MTKKKGLWIAALITFARNDEKKGVIDCRVASLLAMTKKGEWIATLIAFARNDEKGVSYRIGVIARRATPDAAIYCGW